MMRKHKIGMREYSTLKNELSFLVGDLERLNQKDDEGFILFYYDVDANKKKVQRKLWLEEVLSRGYYHIEKNQKGILK